MSNLSRTTWCLNDLWVFKRAEENIPNSHEQAKGRAAKKQESEDVRHEEVTLRGILWECQARLINILIIITKGRNRYIF